MRLKLPLVLAALGWGLLLTAPALAVEEGAQAQMLKQMFQLPATDWPGFLNENAGLLDQSFFERIDARIRWSADSNQVEDAVRFAQVGDLACDAAGRLGGYRLGLVVALQKAGNDVTARGVLEHIMQTHPNSAEARFLRAAYRRLDLDWAGALDDYQRVINQNFRTADCHYYSGLCHNALEKPRDALAAFRRAAALGNELAPAEVERLQKTVIAADVPFSDVAPPVTVDRKVDPAKHAVYFRTAEEANRAGRLATALQNYEDACKADRTQAYYWICLGACRYKSGQPEQAATEIRQGLNLNGKSVEGWRYLACCYERIYDKTLAPLDLGNARHSYEQVLKLMPGDAVARMGLERLAAKKPKTAAGKN